MQDAVVGSWTQESPLSAANLKSLHDLNHRFLDLAVVRRQDWATQGAGVLTTVAGQLAPLSVTQRAAAAECPYALFDLRFQDNGYWLARLRNCAPWQVADEPAVDDDTICFARLALFYAWHVAANAVLAAQLLLGMNGDTAAAFRHITVHHLPALAASEAVHLTARWSECFTFWSALAAAAAHTDRTALRRVQLYGLQLAAAARLPRT